MTSKGMRRRDDNHQTNSLSEGPPLPAGTRAFQTGFGVRILNSPRLRRSGVCVPLMLDEPFFIVALSGMSSRLFSQRHTFIQKNVIMFPFKPLARFTTKRVRALLTFRVQQLQEYLTVPGDRSRQVYRLIAFCCALLLRVLNRSSWSDIILSFFCVALFENENRHEDNQTRSLGDHNAQRQRLPRNVLHLFL